MADASRDSAAWITSLFGELGRRKVFQVAAMYAVAAWLIIQVVGSVSEPLRLPEWLDAVVIVLLGAGFPIALIFAWAFDLTPEGIESASSVRRNERATPKLTYVTHGLVLLAVGFLLVDQYLLAPQLGGLGVLNRPVSTPDAAGTTAGSSHPLRRYDLDLGLTDTIGNTRLGSHLALSSDGTRLVYAANRDGVSRLYVRYLDQIGEQALTGTEGAQHPFFSPDGEWVAYFADETARKLMKIPLRGGRPQGLVETTYSGQGSWHVPGTIIFGSGDANVGRNLYRVPAAGGAPEIVLASTAEAGYVQPDVLPGEAALLFTVRPGNGGVGSADTADIAVMRLEGGEQRRLVERAHTPRYAPTGHVVFVRNRTLWAVPFDAERLETTGPEVPVIPGVQEDRIRGGAAFAFSSDGLLAYLPTDDAEAPPTRKNPIWVDRNGRDESLGIEPEDYGGWALSPDGGRLVLVRDSAGTWDIWIRDLTRGAWTRLNADPARDYGPIWSPDGKRVYYGAEEGDTLEIRAIPVDGTAPPQRVLSSRTYLWPETFSLDGQQLLITRVVRASDIETLSLPAGNPVPLIATPFPEANPRMSPDGRWLAYTSGKTGRQEVYVRPYPNIQDPEWLISLNGGEDPSWDPHGRALYFCSDEGLMAVSLEQPEPSFESVVPMPIIPTAGTGYACGSQTPDGQRFLMSKIVDAPAEERDLDRSRRMIFVEHWFNELTRLAPPAEPTR